MSAYGVLCHGSAQWARLAEVLLWAMGNQQGRCAREEKSIIRGFDTILAFCGGDFHYLSPD
jgi:hypothetical protein